MLRMLAVSNISSVYTTVLVLIYFIKKKKQALTQVSGVIQVLG